MRREKNCKAVSVVQKKERDQNIRWASELRYTTDAVSSNVVLEKYISIVANICIGSLFDASASRAAALHLRHHDIYCADERVNNDQLPAADHHSNGQTNLRP